MAKHGISISEAESKSYIQKYYSKYPSIRRVMGKMKGELERTGYLKDEYGRRFRVAMDKSYKALNAIIQGCAADIMKSAMVRVWKFLKGTRSRIIMTIHDEVVVEIHDSEKHLVRPIRKLMEADSSNFFIPITCSVEYTDGYWADKKEI
jgi:DNA polymerase-1